MKTFRLVRLFWFWVIFLFILSMLLAALCASFIVELVLNDIGTLIFISAVLLTLSLACLYFSLHIATYKIVVDEDTIKIFNFSKIEEYKKDRFKTYRIFGSYQKHKTYGFYDSENSLILTLDSSAIPKGFIKHLKKDCSLKLRDFYGHIID